VFYAISPDYFRTLGIPLLRGRTFTAADTLDAPRVAIISESLARQHFPDQDPLGQHIHITNADSEIIGVVADTKHFDLGREFRVQAYEPHAQVPFDFLTFVVRHAPTASSALPVTALPAAIRSAIYAVDPEQPIASVRSLKDLVAQSVSRQRFALVLFVVFSVLALVLSTIGVYGVMAYSVAQRTSEIGLRVALGAQRSDVLRLIFRQAGRMVALGLFSGLLGAFALTRFLSSLLFDVSSYDPLTFAAITCILAAVAMLACLVPAWRATKVDPMVALRAD
jgi:putative ABC transport system permease protein